MAPHHFFKSDNLILRDLRKHDMRDKTVSIHHLVACKAVKDGKNESNLTQVGAYFPFRERNGGRLVLHEGIVVIGELVLVEPWQGMPDDYSNQKAGRSRSVFWWVGLLAFLAGPTALFASVVLKVSGTALLMLLYEIFFLLIVALLLFGIDGWLPHLNEEEEKQG